MSSEFFVGLPMVATKPLSLVLALALLPGLSPAMKRRHLTVCCRFPSATLQRRLAAAFPVAGRHTMRWKLDIPEVFAIGLQTSPWRMYDIEGRILTVEEVAAVIRARRPDSDKRVRLVGSWTAARPDGSKATLAHRLSDALDGFPVDGSDGFLWLSPKGGMRTTHQAFSVWKTGPYRVGHDEDVLMALVPGAMAQFEDQFSRDGSAEGVLQAGIGYDVFMLCQERALTAFERAAGMGNAIGAYNAGLMHAESGDRSTAITWREKAETLGETKARAALATLREASQETTDAAQAR